MRLRLLQAVVAHHRGLYVDALRYINIADQQCKSLKVVPSPALLQVLNRDVDPR